MKIKALAITLLCIQPMLIHATNHIKKPPNTVCNSSPFGTFCELQVKVKPTPKYTDYSYCGRTYVAITPEQRKVLNSYLSEHKNMVVRFSLDDEFINAPCF